MATVRSVRPAKCRHRSSFIKASMPTAQRAPAALLVRREAAGVSEVMNVIGDVKGCDCVLIDDIVDSAGTLCNAAVALMDQGAKSV